MEYLDYEFNDTADFIETFDELPLWSAPFGLLLLKHVELKPYPVVLDIGCGAGFPLFELAQRLGKTSKCYGIDPWINANTRARLKIKNYEVANVEIIEGTAAKLPFDNEGVDLIVSNLGINNFDNPGEVFKECHRVLKPGGKLALTTNLYGHWREFYKVFEDTLTQLKKPTLLTALREHEEHRGSVASISSLFSDNGFVMSRHFEEKFEMRFLNGSAFLRHYFIKLGFLSTWKSFIPTDERRDVFAQLESNLNAYAEKYGELFLSVPMAYIEGTKVTSS